MTSPSSTATSVFQTCLDELASTVKVDVPFVSGVCALPKEMSMLVYGRGNSGGHLDFINASEDGLRHLVETCGPARIHQDRRRILDESILKAKSLSKYYFQSTFDPDRLGLIEAIRTSLFGEHDESRAIEADLGNIDRILERCYRERSSIRAQRDDLMIYEEQSFCAHRHFASVKSELLLGFLTVIYPVPHEGGTMVLRSGDREWTVDSGTLLSTSSGPSIAYVAYGCDVEPQVLPITSGYRVTVTYSLWSSQSPRYKLARSVSNHDFPNFRMGLRELVADDSFLPDGGLLGFGLRHKYPVPYYDSQARNMMEDLKGSYAAIKVACEALDIQLSARAVYEDFKEFIMCKIAASLEGEVFDDYGLTGHLLSECDGIYLESKWHDGPKIYWVTQPTEVNKLHEECANYDMVYHIYGHLCLVAKIPPSNRRTT